MAGQYSCPIDSFVWPAGIYYTDFSTIGANLGGPLFFVLHVFVFVFVKSILYFVQALKYLILLAYKLLI